MRHGRRLLAVAGLTSLLVSCGGAPPAQAAPPTVAQAPTPSPPKPPPPAAPTKATYPGAPATPAGDQLAWVLDATVNRHGKLDAPEIQAHFAPPFLAALPVPTLQQLFAQLANTVPSATIAKVEAKGDFELIAHVAVESAKLKILLTVDPQTKLISGMRFMPDLDVGPKPKSFDEAKQMLAAIAPKSDLLVAALDHGKCKALQSVAPSDELAIGSAFKLYVLVALADFIKAGKAQWTDDLAVRDEAKSLPTGVTQDDAAGTKHPLRLFAERMISISDNTATDHLIGLVGRKSVEAALKSAHHAKPALDTPFLTTRQLFALKLGSSADEVAKYLAMTDAQKRDYLDKSLATRQPDLSQLTGWKTARQIDKLEWFASADDMCNAMAALWQRGQDPKTAAVLEVLAKNPGLALDTATWPYIGFKGGSEPGVMDLTYLLKRADGKWFVATVTVNAAEGGEVDEGKMIGLMSGVVELTAGLK